MVSERIIHTILQAFFHSDQHSLDGPIDEEKMVSICKLICTVGKKAEKHSSSASGKWFQHYFKKMDKIVKNGQCSARARFMCMDVIDLRNNGWNPRREQPKAQTIEEFRKAVQQQANAAARGGSNGGFRRSDFGNQDIRGGQKSVRNTAPVPVRRDRYASTGNSHSSSSLNSKKMLHRNHERSNGDVRGKSKERRKSQTRGSGATKRSSSRETSSRSQVSRPKKSAPEPEEEEEMDDETIARKIKSLLNEYISHLSIKELDLSLEETNVKGSDFVKVTLLECMEVTSKKLEHYANIVGVDAKNVSSADMKQGTLDALAFLDDMVLDCGPNAVKHTGYFLGHAICAKKLKCEASLFDSSATSTPRLLVNILATVKKLNGPVQEVYGEVAGQFGKADKASLFEREGLEDLLGDA